MWAERQRHTPTPRQRQAERRRDRDAKGREKAERQKSVESRESEESERERERLCPPRRKLADPACLALPPRFRLYRLFAFLPVTPLACQPYSLSLPCCVF